MLLEMRPRNYSLNELGGLEIKITREMVKDNNINAILKLLLPLVNDKQSVLDGENKLTLTFLGAEDEENFLLCEDRQLRQWMQRLTEQFPYWLHFANSDNRTLRSVIELLAAGSITRRISLNSSQLRMIFHIDQLPDLWHSLISPTVQLFEDVDLPRKSQIQCIARMQRVFEEVTSQNGDQSIAEAH